MSWPELHGALTHFPIALLITASAFDIGAVVLRQPSWRIVSFWMLVVAVVMAVPSLIAGWMAGSEMFGGVAQPPSTFVWHRAAAFTASGVALILLLWRALSHDNLAGGALAGAVAVVMVAAGVVGFTGYLGGRMVFAGQGHAGPAGAEHPAHPGAPGAPATAERAVPKDLVPGRQVFQKTCVGCHGANGEGKIGPKLAGSFLDEEQIKKTVTRGVPPTMPAFGKQLSPAQLQAVAAYVHWLATNP